MSHVQFHIFNIKGCTPSENVTYGEEIRYLGYHLPFPWVWKWTWGISHFLPSLCSHVLSCLCSAALGPCKPFLPLSSSLLSSWGLTPGREHRPTLISISVPLSARAQEGALGWMEAFPPGTSPPLRGMCKGVRPFLGQGGRWGGVGGVEWVWRVTTPGPTPSLSTAPRAWEGALAAHFWREDLIAEPRKCTWLLDPENTLPRWKKKKKRQKNNPSF